MISASASRLFLAALFVCYVLAVSGRPLLRGQGAALVDELEGLRQRLLGEDGFSKSQWTRKLSQQTPYSSYGGYYGYGYYGYGYGGYADPYANMGGMAMRRRALLSNGEKSASRDLLMNPYPMYGYGYYYGYGGYYGGYSDPYAGMSGMAMHRRRMLGSLEHLSEIVGDEADGFVQPGDKSYLEDASNGRDLQSTTPYWGGNYGYYYGYGYYGAYGGGYADPYAGMSGMAM